MKIRQLIEEQDEFEEIFTIDSKESWQSERGKWIFHSPIRLKAVYNGYDQVTFYDITIIERILRNADRRAKKLTVWGSYMIEVEDILVIDKLVDELMLWFAEEWGIKGDKDDWNWPWYFIAYSKGDL